MGRPSALGKRLQGIQGDPWVCRVPCRKTAQGRCSRLLGQDQGDERVPPSEPHLQLLRSVPPRAPQVNLSRWDRCHSDPSKNELMAPVVFLSLPPISASPGPSHGLIPTLTPPPSISKKNAVHRVKPSGNLFSLPFHSKFLPSVSTWEGGVLAIASLCDVVLGWSNIC